MFNQLMSRETMKKFWNLMLVALVMLGAAACTETNDSVNASQESLSFYAEISNEATRADLEYDAENKVWNTVWEGNETIAVKDAANNVFNFVNSTEEPAKFTCTQDGVKKLLGQSVNISIAHPEQSKVGKRGVAVSVDVEAFDNSKTIKLEATNSFLRYTYNGAGKVEFSLTYEGGKAFVYNEGQAYDSVAIEGVKGENFVSFNAPAEGAEAELAFSVDGIEVKRKAINVFAGTIYNLGELAMPYETSAYSVVGTHNGWNAGATPMYLVGDYAVAYGVEFTGSSNAFKVLGNDKWLGTDSFSLNTWTSLAVETADISIAAGKYDFYFSESECKLCVVTAGAEVPAMPVFSVGLVGLGGNWEVDVDMTEEGDYYTMKGVNIAATDTFKLRISDSWAENYGIASDTSDEQVAINYDAMYTLVKDGKNMQLAAGTYDLYFNYATKEFYALTPGTTPDDLAIPQYKIYVYQYKNTWTKLNMYSWDGAGANHTGAWPGTASTATETINGYEYKVWTMPRTATAKQLNVIINDGTSQTADFVLGTLDKDYYLLLSGVSLSFIEDKENPEPEVVEGEPQPSTWALAGDFNSWGDLVMYTTNTTNLFVAKSVKIGAYKEIKVKAVGNWNTSYGGGINYLNANIWTKVYSGGSNLSIINEGVYDIYFDNDNKRIYVMNEGTGISEATEQSSNGAAPDLSGASWGLCGAHNNWSAPDIKLEWDGTIGLYVAYNAKLTGEFKVRANNSWGEDYGCGGTITVNSATGKSMSRGGGNCKVASGTYDVYFDLATKKIWVKTPGSAAPTK